MPDRRVIIAPRVGLHARPAARFVKAAASSGCDVRLGRPGQQAVDARSMLSVLSLSANYGDEMVISVEGGAAETVLEALARLLETDDDESAEPNAPAAAGTLTSP
jgi:phosphocarrier protein HPr